MQEYLQALESLPVKPDVASRVLAMAEEDMNFSFSALENTIKMDPGLSSRILKVANSALYGHSGEVKTLQNAIALLGFRNLKSLVVLVTASSLYRKKEHADGVLAELWKESFEAAFYSKALATLTNQGSLAEEAFLASLLQDIGKLAFALAKPELYKELRGAPEAKNPGTDGLPPDDFEAAREAETFGTNHRLLGREIMSRWNFPGAYADTCRDHGYENTTSKSKRFVFLSRVGSYLSRIPKNQPLPAGYLRILGSASMYLSINPRDLETLRVNIENLLHVDPIYTGQSEIGP